MSASLDTLTLREAAQAITAWLTAQQQRIGDWVTSLGDIRVGTIFSLVMLGLSVLVVWLLLDMAFRISDLTWQYHAHGYSWVRAFRLALADWDAALLARQRRKNPYYQGQPSRWAATPEDRAAWAQDLEQGR
jgi:hypothetical protein